MGVAHEFSSKFPDTRMFDTEEGAVNFIRSGFPKMKNLVAQTREDRFLYRADRLGHAVGKPLAGVWSPVIDGAVAVVK